MKGKSFFETLLDEVTEKNQQYEEVYESEVENSQAVAEAETYEENKFSYDDLYEERNYEEADDALTKSTLFEQQNPIPESKSRLRRKKGNCILI